MMSVINSSTYPVTCAAVLLINAINEILDEKLFSYLEVVYGYKNALVRL